MSIDDLLSGKFMEDEDEEASTMHYTDIFKISYEHLFYRMRKDLMPKKTMTFHPLTTWKVCPIQPSIDIYIQTIFNDSKK